MIYLISETSLLLNYLITIIVSIAVALLLGMPFLPEKPRRFSWTKSAVFPTAIIAMGILAFCFSINFYWLYDGKLLAIIIGVLSAVFVKYLFRYVFPDSPNAEGGNNE
ncbi:MAG: energy-converting hydrogenase A subunit A EhaA [Methanobrevibacter boviskoreani]|jgi:energy-converting hydrogenase A subunit A|uniref:energy-converting hydrogenase A subunit A EhaA n=1 Tax=Methanobrevibacter boviskoreani TaxID=1348249 RepID=UPI00059368CA|nr:energy-converting hydrogenase A subunit A EhaA [Methanobrevibacter boviskoreani]MCI6774916.1 energy-converting hydrogenase A subunit A EhaA [Methanobrevibacter boviskoreani]MCI6931451.1 energy-converting hydrogenase A subunit A EhaA [Methanobrevibacter boviskoreani]MDD6257343.1 energy-converting hydrogenase A subunit A EhaA [Methanobrevibacter boviskoreani]MDY5613789.1 energy-converting hydrogenase A subunit A EhaA [Methanobrevibacter boviskoreani]